MLVRRKQDLQGVRTPKALEQKYGFEKTKKTAEGAANTALSAQKTAEEAKQAASGLDSKLSQTEIFNRLTNNGQAQGVFMDDNGDIYINAEYIVSLSKMFAKDITMTGTFESVAQAFLPPTYEDVSEIQTAILFPESHRGSVYLCDLNGDGLYNDTDVQLARDLYLGNIGFEACPGMQKSSVTMRINMSDTDKPIHIFGTNMWGSYVETCIGANPGKGSFAMKKHLDNMFKCDPGDANDLIYRTLSDGTKEWLNPPMTQDNVLYRTYERLFGAPVYTMLVVDLADVPLGYTIIRKSDTISHYFGDFIQVWLVPEDNGDE